MGVFLIMHACYLVSELQLVLSLLHDNDIVVSYNTYYREHNNVTLAVELCVQASVHGLSRGASLSLQI